MNSLGTLLSRDVKGHSEMPDSSRRAHKSRHECQRIGRSTPTICDAALAGAGRIDSLVVKVELE
jgi:hypothetical protein